MNQPAMNFIEQLKSASLIEPLGWTILHSIWQGAAIALLAAIALRLARRRSPQARYVIACGALLSMLIVACVTFAYLHGSSPVPEKLDLQQPIVMRAQVGQIQSLHSAKMAPPVLPPPTLADRIRPILPSLALAWLAGVLLLGAYHAGGWMVLRRLRGRAWSIDDARCRLLLADLLIAMRINRPVRLCESMFVQVPTVIGWLWPVILLPASAIIGLSPLELRGLLAHELAHIRRHDYLVNLIQTIIETLLFYHPATWWLGKVIRQERENCCDDLAAAVCDRTTYAQALATMESLRQAPALALSARGGALLPRIRRILGVPASSSHRSISSGVVSASILVVIIAGGIVLNACRSNPKAPVTKATQLAEPAESYTNPTAADLIPPTGEYRMGPGDLVTVSVVDANGNEAVKSTRVKEDGMVFVPKTGSILAKGCTAKELQDDIVKAYDKAPGADVNRTFHVTITEARGRAFSIRGAVEQPGRYAIPKNDFRLLDALAMARDTKMRVETIYIVRDEPNSWAGHRIIQISFDRLRQGDPKENVVILSNDVIQVIPPDDQARQHAAAQPTTIPPDDRTAYAIYTRALTQQSQNAADAGEKSSREALLEKNYAELQNRLRTSEAKGDLTSPEAEQLLTQLAALHAQRLAVQAQADATASTQPAAGKPDFPSGNDINSRATLADLQSTLHALDYARQDQLSKLDAATQASGENSFDAAVAREHLSALDEARDRLTKRIAEKSAQSRAATTQAAGTASNGIAPNSPATQPALPKTGEYYVSGVPLSGAYWMGKRITVLQALIAAGLTPSTPGNLVAVRHEQGGSNVYAIPNLRQHDDSAPVLPGDVLMVVQRTENYSEYYVGGDVPRVGVYSIPSQGINVLQAIIAAGGDPFKIADNEVEIRHRMSNGKDEIHRTTIADLMNAHVKLPTVQANDQILVHKASTTRPTSQP